MSFPARVLTRLLVGFVLISAGLLPTGGALAQEPERGNFVPPDLEVRTHPFVEQKRFGGEYFSGRLLEPTKNGWAVMVLAEEAGVHSIPEYRITLDEAYREEGNRVMVQRMGPEDYLVSDLDRRYQYLMLIGAGLLLCMLVGGWVTVRSLLAVLAGIAYFMFWTVPRILDGAPILIEFSLFYLLVSFLVLPSVIGWNRRTLSALITAISTGLLALLILIPLGTWLGVTGLWSDSFQVLDYGARYFPGTTEPINFRHLILGATLIGALGVILDVCVDVTASAAEIARQRPELGLRELLRRTITVSSRLVGTMTNTLLLAYVGVNMLLLITLYLLPVSGWIILNQDLVAVEVLRALGGALAFLAAVPLAILFYGLLFRRDKPDPPEKDPDAEADLELPERS